MSTPKPTVTTTYQQLLSRPRAPPDVDFGTLSPYSTLSLSGSGLAWQHPQAQTFHLNTVEVAKP